MFFKARPNIANLIFVAFIVIFSMIGCGLQFGEKVKKDRTVQLDGVQCMSQITDNVRAYLNAEMSASQWSAFMSCVQNTFRVFLDYTEGENKDYYRPEEIQNFLLENFVKDRPITNDLTREMMRWKVTIVGGELDRFTRAEFGEFVEVLGELRSMSLQLLPYMSVLNFKVGDERVRQNQSLPNAKDAARVLREVSEQMVHLFRPTGRAYPMAQFETFLNEMLNFIFATEGSVHIQTAEKWTQLLTLLKQIAIAGSSTRVEPEEWRSFLTAFGNWYGIFIEWRYDISFTSINRQKSMLPVMNLVERIIDRIDTAVRAQNGQKILFSKTSELTLVLERMSLLPAGLTANHMNQTLPQLVVKLFGNPNTPSSERRVTNTNNGLSLAHVNVLRSEYQKWKTFQQRIDDTAQRGRSIPDLVNNPINISPAAQVQTITEIYDRSRWLARLPALFTNQSLRPVYSRENLIERNRIDYFDLSAKNLMFSLVGLGAAGYAEEPFRSTHQLGIRENEMANLINQNAWLLADLKVMHPRSEKVGERMYMEANLFTYSGSGMNKEAPTEFANLIDPSEGLELATFMLSNVFATRRFLNDMWSECPLPESLNGQSRRQLTDYFGYALIDRTCFLRNFQNLLTANWSQSPGMQQHLRGLNQRDWQMISDQMMSMVSDYDTQTQDGHQYVQSTQVASMLMILHYIEAMFLKFDTDGSLIIDGVEAEAAWIRFKGLLKEMTQKECQNFSDRRLRRIFFHILNTRSLPPDLFAWSGVGLNDNETNLRMGRTDVLKTFMVIVGQNKKTVQRQCR